ncbi:MAG: hypothetical protein LBG43_02550 [Treponema sp.]|nr:hypothetical protein [Treponema sp.]
MAKRLEKIFQYGEGNFSRGFVDWMIDIPAERIPSGTNYFDCYWIRLYGTILTRNEINNYREIAIFKNGVTL